MGFAANSGHNLRCRYFRIFFPFVSLGLLYTSLSCSQKVALWDLHRPDFSCVLSVEGLDRCLRVQWKDVNVHPTTLLPPHPGVAWAVGTFIHSQISC